jgi:O-antigen ligase
MVNSFKIAVVVMAVYFSLFSLSNFYVVDSTDIGVIKDLIGTQRTGFIHTLAIFLLIFPTANFRINKNLRLLILIIIFIGLILTFSRTPIISILITYVIFNMSLFSKKSLVKWISNIFISFSIFAGLVIFFSVFFPDIYAFFNGRIFERFFMGDTEDILVNPETSEGTRVQIWKLILNYVLCSPFFGSGYLGTYALSSSISYGSAHSQYMDVLFRTGFLGFVVYIFILYFIGKELFLKDRSLFWGYVSILVYGLFHETFKESQGGFILAFLIGYASCLYKNRKVIKRNEISDY